MPYIPRRRIVDSAQLSCHDAPIFRLLLKIAVSLTASNVTFSIFVRLRAANNLSSRNLSIRKIYIERYFFPLGGCDAVSLSAPFFPSYTRRVDLTWGYHLTSGVLHQLTWLALGHDQAGGSRSAEQVTAL